MSRVRFTLERARDNTAIATTMPTDLPSGSYIHYIMIRIIAPYGCIQRACKTVGRKVRDAHHGWK